MIKIGIYFQDRQWGKRVADAIFTNKNENIFIRGYQSSCKFHFEFKDVTIDIIPAINSSRGYKFDIIYLQDEIDIDAYHTIILPCLMYRMTSDIPPIKILTDEEIDNFGIISAVDIYPNIFKKN